MKIHTAAVSAAALFTLVSCTEGGVESASGGADELNRSDCIAYIWLDANARANEGEITDQELQDVGTRLAGEIQNKGDNFNYANTYRILDNRLDRIVESGVTYGEVAQKVEECRPIVHI